MHAWKLRDLSIFSKGFRATKAIRAVAGTVPSVICRDEDVPSVIRRDEDVPSVIRRDEDDDDEISDSDESEEEEESGPNEWQLLFDD